MKRIGEGVMVFLRFCSLLQFDNGYDKAKWSFKRKEAGSVGDGHHVTVQARGMAWILSS
jgi:hypothetical protein